jgi:hypothetical protein
LGETSLDPGDWRISGISSGDASFDPGSNLLTTAKPKVLAVPGPFASFSLPAPTFIHSLRNVELRGHLIPSVPPPNDFTGTNAAALQVLQYEFSDAQNIEIRSGENIHEWDRTEHQNEGAAFLNLHIHAEHDKEQPPTHLRNAYSSLVGLLDGVTTTLDPEANDLEMPSFEGDPIPGTTKCEYDDLVGRGSWLSGIGRNIRQNPADPPELVAIAGSIRTCMGMVSQRG